MNFMKIQFKNLQPVYILFKKEFFSFLKSPLPCAALLIFISGAALPLIGGTYWLSSGISDFKPYFLNMPLLLSLIIPMLTMNIWADEKKQNTNKLLRSFPISERIIVYGKYTAVASIWFFMCIISLAIPLSILELVHFDFNSFILSYCAVFLFGCGASAFCTAVSLISKHSAINFITGLALTAFFNLIHLPAKFFNIPGFIKNIFFSLSFTTHFEAASIGVFDSRDFIFYILFMITGIELNIFILELQRQR